MARHGARLTWTISETAEQLSLTVDEVLGCIQTGELPCITVGDRRFVPVAAVRLLIDTAMAEWDPRQPAAAYLTAAELKDLCELLSRCRSLLSTYVRVSQRHPLGGPERVQTTVRRLAQVIDSLAVRQLEVEYDGVPAAG